MKKLLLLFSFLLTLSSKAQTGVYHPFPDSNAVWNVRWVAAEVIGPDSICLDQLEWSYIIGGDTLINSLKYTKVNSPYCNWVTRGFCGFFPYCGLSGAIRQDTSLRKVWFIAERDSVEKLLYDFNLNVGDTIHSPDCSPSTTVILIDSVLIGSSYRKQWHFSDTPVPVIEGIGSLNGLLENLCGYCFDSECTMLLCFQEKGSTLYNDSINAISCNIISSINIFPDVTLSAKLFPNPFHATATLEIKNKEFSNAELKIYDRMGRLVQRQLINSPSTTIHRNLLAGGIYFYQLVSDKGQMVRGKFVIE